MDEVQDEFEELEQAGWRQRFFSMERFRRLLGWITWPLVAGFFLVHAWFGTRRWSLLAVSAPAWLLGLAVLGTVCYARYRGEKEIFRRYALEFNKALEAPDEAAVAMAGRKLTQLEPGNPEARYALAWLTEKNGDHQRVEELMRELAPVDAVGHPRAHLWMAARMLVGPAYREASDGAATAADGSASDAGGPNADRSVLVNSAATPARPSLTADDFRALVHHLMVALRVNSQREPAHIMLARLWLAVKNFDQAAEHLRAVVPQRPDLRVALADVYLAQGDTARGKDELKLAAEHLQRVVAAEPANGQARILWAQALAKGEAFEQAERVLVEGLLADPNGQVRQALAGFCIARYDQTRQAGAQVNSGIEHLQRALTYAPNNVEALTRLAALSTEAGPDVPQARALLKDALARGETPAAVHLVLGTAAASVDQVDEAKMHLEQAYRLNPKAPAILNNLAWVLATAKPPDLQRALELANAALELTPRHPEMLATRGHIYMLLQRWQESLADLEAALAGLGSRPNIHESLARVYTQLGDAELAQRHRDLAAGERPASPGN